jgi:hypothetical protein
MKLESVSSVRLETVGQLLLHAEIHSSSQNDCHPADTIKNMCVGATDAVQPFNHATLKKVGVLMVFAETLGVIAA